MSLPTRWSRARDSLAIIRCVVDGTSRVADARAIASLTLPPKDKRHPTTSYHDTKKTTSTWLLSAPPRVALPSFWSRGLNSCFAQENYGLYSSNSNNTSATHKFEANKGPDAFDSIYSNQVLQQRCDGDLLSDRDADDCSPELLEAMNTAIKMARKKGTTMRSNDDQSLYRDLSSWMPFLEADATPTRALTITFATMVDAQKILDERERAARENCDSQELRRWLDFTSAAANACRLFSEPSYRRTDDEIKEAMKTVDDALQALLTTVNEMESNQRQRQQRVIYELLRVVRLKHEETRLGEYLAVLDELLNDRDAFEERSSYERLFRKLSLLGRDSELDELLVHMKNHQRLFEPRTGKGVKAAEEEKDFIRLNTQLYCRLLKSKNTALIRRKLLEEFASLIQENVISSPPRLLPLSLSSEMVAQITRLLRSPSIVVNSDWELADRLTLDYIRRYRFEDHHDRNRDYHKACNEWLASYGHDTTKQQWIVTQMIENGITPTSDASAL